MSGELDLRGGLTAGAATLLICAGILTRAACVSAPRAAARAPATPTVDARTDDAVVGSSNAAASATASARSTNEAGLVEDAPRATAAPDAPFTASTAASPPPGSADAKTQMTAAPNGAPPSSQRQDVGLLASIERDLKREAPPEVHALLGEYRRGADRATLIAHVHRELPKDLPQRVTVLRWIDQVRPDPNHPTPARPPAPGQGTGAGWVRPLER
jgi:hypothetical protein